MKSIPFTPDKDIPDLSGKVIFVTGGNSGLGKETVLQLSKHKPACIFLASRSVANAEAALKDIKAAVPNPAPISVIELDLASLNSVHRAANEFLRQSSELHLLINNAGIMACPPGLTKDGYEIQFGTNHIGHALLTKLLLPVLEKTAQTGSDVRIITLSSNAEQFAPTPTPYNPDELKTEMTSKSTFARYGISKLANLHHSRSLSRRYPNIKCISLNPGGVNTGLSRGLYSSYPLIAPVIRVLAPFISKTVATGAKNQLWASVSPDAKSGEFYFPVAMTGKGSQGSNDRAAEDKLWEYTEQELEKFLQGRLRGKE
ncbi:retinol dehydrogenase [Dactylonectria macrodidyma]|uniref:Retinol dehydrogenase n=1 Tax=Dactylonectria macrodidyma TaxID=307937 RepID=A0A9P9ILZ5_9HYPO|nr:retinol dehydrogenase [Dactylonectria macrodidyma]